MSKFLGVISNSPQSPSDDRVLEFTDLDLLANFLFNETHNLFYEFLNKGQFINDQETIIDENYTKLMQIYEFCHQIFNITQNIERDAEQVGWCLSNMEKSINRMEKWCPVDFVACKCTSNLERNSTLAMLVKLSADVSLIGNQVRTIEEMQYSMPVKDPSDWLKLVPFLDLHTKILEHIEQKISKLTDMHREVDEMFINAHKRLIGACYHKPRYDNSSDC